MHFLIDENLPSSIASCFTDLGHTVEQVRNIPTLRGKPDEVIFEYAAINKCVIVTRDVNFANQIRFTLSRLPGIVLLRFPNEIPTGHMCSETKRLISTLATEQWHNIIIVAPNILRLRRVSQ